MTALLLGVVMAQAAPARSLVFGEPGRWILVDENGSLVRSLEFPPAIPTDVRDVAVSPDGTRFAVAAWLPSAHNVMLFLWDTRTGATHQIGDGQGFHAAPSFSQDGRTLTFAHHPNKGGPPGMHQDGAWSQLYQQDLETLEVIQLTSERGCHMESAASQQGLYFSHADCRGGRRLELFRNGVATALTQFGDGHGEPSLSRDGKRLVFTVARGDDIELAEIVISTRTVKPQSLWRGGRQGTRFRPQFLRDGSVMFQNGARLLVLKHGVAEVRDFGGVR